MIQTGGIAAPPICATIIPVQTTPPPMNLSDLSINTAWIIAVDQDAELIVEENALWIVFCADAGWICDYAPGFSCIDLKSDDAWICWDDASEEQKESAKVFRYILIAD